MIGNIFLFGRVANHDLTSQVLHQEALAECEQEDEGHVTRLTVVRDGWLGSDEGQQLYASLEKEVGENVPCERLTVELLTVKGWLRRFVILITLFQLFELTLMLKYVVY